MPPLDEPPLHDDATDDDDDDDTVGGGDPDLDAAHADLDDDDHVLDTAAELPDDADTPELLLQDLQEYEELRAAGFTGEAWKAHGERTFTYAYRVIYRWALDGVLFQRAREMGTLNGRDLLPSQQVRFTEAETLDLTAYLMKWAIAAYRTALVEGKWRPEKGRRLRSYFVGQMMFQLVRRYWAWCEARELENKPREKELPNYEAMEPLHGEVYAWTDPETAVIAAEVRDAVNAVAKGDALLLRIVGMEAAGFEDREIAAATGLTNKAVELRLRRFRRIAAVRRSVA